MTFRNLFFLCIGSLLIDINHSSATTYYYFWRFEGTGITEGYLSFQNIGQQYPDTLSVSQSQNFNNYFPNHDQVVAGGDLSTWSITGGNGFGWSGTEILASEFQATRIHNSNFYNINLETHTPGSYFCENPTQPNCNNGETGDYEFNPPSFVNNSLNITYHSPAPFPILGFIPFLKTIKRLKKEWQKFVNRI